MKLDSIRELIVSGHGDQAEKELEEYLSSNPNDAQALELLWELKDDLDPRSEESERVEPSTSGEWAGHITQIRTLLEGQRIDDAQWIFEQLEESVADDIQLSEIRREIQRADLRQSRASELSERTQNAIADNRLEEASRHLSDLEAVDPQHPRIGLLRSKIDSCLAAASDPKSADTDEGRDDKVVETPPPPEVEPPEPAGGIGDSEGEDSESLEIEAAGFEKNQEPKEKVPETTVEDEPAVVNPSRPAELTVGIQYPADFASVPAEDTISEEPPLSHFSAVDILSEEEISETRTKGSSLGLFLVGSLLAAAVIAFVLWYQNRQIQPVDPREIPRITVTPLDEIVVGCDSSEDSECAEDEKPPAKLERLPVYTLATSETTWFRYRACMEAGACARPAADLSDLPDEHPVTQVTRGDAEAFCQWARGGRLPSEIEWEIAAKAAAKGASDDHRSDGNPNHGSEICCGPDDADGWEKTGPVDSSGTNPLGFHGMLGNVAEWTSTSYVTDLYDIGQANSDELVTVRGGSWIQPPNMARATARQALSPEIRSGSVGFRCAWDGNGPED